MTRAEVVEPLATREVLIQVQWGASIKIGTEVSSGRGGMGASACVSIDAKFFQRGHEGSAVMLA